VELEIYTGRLFRKIPSNWNVSEKEFVMISPNSVFITESEKLELKDGFFYVKLRMH